MKQINKKAIAAAFGRAANSYNRYDQLQKRSTWGLLSLLGTRNFTTVLDAGCGPGNNSLFWRETGSWVIALDLSIAMLEKARERKAANAYLIGDIEAIPLAEEQFDLVWSHLALQWCTSLSLALSSLYSVTRPGGKLAFTTLLADSLCELVQAFRSVDEKPHVNCFLTKQAVESILSMWNYRSNIQVITLYFKNAQSAMYSLKGIGATYLNHGRSQNFLTKRKLQCLEKTWPKKSKCYPLTYQLLHGVIDRD